MRHIGSAAYLKYGALYARRTGSAAYWKGDAPAMHSAPAMRRIGNAMYRTLEPILFYAPPNAKSAADCAKLPGDGRVSLGWTKSSASIVSQHLAHA